MVNAWNRTKDKFLSTILVRTLVSTRIIVQVQVGVQVLGKQIKY